MSIRNKLFIPVLLIVVLLVVSSALSLFIINRLKTDIEVAVQTSQHINEHINRINSLRQQAREDTLMFKIAGEERYLVTADQASATISSILNELRPLVTTKQGQDYLQAFETERAKVIGVRRALQTALASGDKRTADRVFESWQIIADNSAAALADFTSYNQISLKQVTLRYGSILNSIIILQCIAIIILVSLVLLFYLYLKKIISNPLLKITAAAQHIADGTYTNRAAITSHDEMGILADNLHDMAIKLGAYRRSLQHKIDLKERELKAVKKLEHQKDDFIGIASHELKTPVTSIKAYAHVLERVVTQQQPKQTADVLRKMVIQINRLATLINDLLDVTKIQTGKLLLQQELFNLNELVQEVVGQVQVAFVQKIEVKLGKAVTLRGDRDRLAQVLINFLTNAAKFSSDDQPIKVTTSRSKDEAVVMVKDQGPGIPLHKQTRIFRRFYQVESYRRSSHPGLGLGLYISREIIRRHRGRIWVESRLGHGAAFYFSLPLQSTLDVH